MQRLDQRWQLAKDNWTLLSNPPSAGGQNDRRKSFRERESFLVADMRQLRVWWRGGGWAGGRWSSTTGPRPTLGAYSASHPPPPPPPLQTRPQTSARWAPALCLGRASSGVEREGRGDELVSSSHLQWEADGGQSLLLESGSSQRNQVALKGIRYLSKESGNR